MPCKGAAASAMHFAVPWYVTAYDAGYPFDVRSSRVDRREDSAAVIVLPTTPRELRAFIAPVADDLVVREGEYRSMFIAFCPPSLPLAWNALSGKCRIVIPIDVYRTRRATSPNPVVTLEPTHVMTLCSRTATEDA